MGLKIRLPVFRFIWKEYALIIVFLYISFFHCLCLACRSFFNIAISFSTRIYAILIPKSQLSEIGQYDFLKKITKVLLLYPLTSIAACLPPGVLLGFVHDDLTMSPRSKQERSDVLSIQIYPILICVIPAKAGIFTLWTENWIAIYRCVIPAQAGIHTQWEKNGKTHCQCVIPAQAGIFNFWPENWITIYRCVIPAKAGIHTQWEKNGKTHCQCVIPAKAGIFTLWTENWIAIYRCVIPAQAGIQNQRRKSLLFF